MTIAIRHSVSNLAAFLARFTALVLAAQLVLVPGVHAREPEAPSTCAAAYSLEIQRAFDLEVSRVHELHSLSSPSEPINNRSVLEKAAGGAVLGLGAGLFLVGWVPTAIALGVNGALGAGAFGSFEYGLQRERQQRSEGVREAAQATAEVERRFAELRVADLRFAQGMLREAHEQAKGAKDSELWTLRALAERFECLYSASVPAIARIIREYDRLGGACRESGVDSSANLIAHVEGKLASASFGAPRQANADIASNPKAGAALGASNEAGKRGAVSGKRAD